MKHAVTLAASLAAISMAIAPIAAQARDKDKSAFPKVEDPVSFPNSERQYDAVFSGRPAVQRVRVPGGTFISRPMNDLAPQSLVSKRVEIDIRSEVPTLADLQMLLEEQGVFMTIDYGSLYEAAEADGQVGAFTAASRFQSVANSASAGSGIRSNNTNATGGFGTNGNMIGDNNSWENQGIETEGSAAEEVTIAGPDFSAAPQSPVLLKRVVPFRQFRGTVGELMRRLENAGNIAVWYQGGLVVGGARRYSIAVLQQQDIVQSVVNELRKLGATNVVGSVGAGQVFYSAPPRTNAEVIDPYVRRLAGNLSEITMQVALVSVAMSRDAERGFDWSVFNLGYGANVSRGPQPAGTSGGDGGMGGSTPPPPLGGGSFTLSPNAFDANFGDLLGTGKILTVAGAIKFLSEMGQTSVAQNVELRTLSGSPVILRSGEDIPYVSGVGSNFAGGNSGGVAQSAQTERLGTGLTLNVDPRYDSSSGIVTMDMGLKLVDLVEFVQLDAGNQLGTLTQPRTREQGINSLLRVPAGQTTILGGIRRELTGEQKNGPFGLFGIGSKSRQHEVFWLFAVVRPVVTVYETADSPLAPRSVLDTRTTVNPYDEGSYGVAGVMGQTAPYGADAQTTLDGGQNSYYYQGGFTPANRMPAGVTTASPPAPRDVIVPGAGTQPEVNGNLPGGSVLRDPGAPGAGFSVDAKAAPVPVPAAGDINETSRTNEPPANRSFIRPMTAEEKAN